MKIQAANCQLQTAFMSKFYITTAIDYTNDVIHIGHTYQKIIADVLARYHRLIGDKVFFLTGTDEHGGKSEKAAEKTGQDVKDFVNEIAKKDQQELDALNISYDRFIRTTDPDHIETVQKFWKEVVTKNPDDIYLGDFEGLYCQGCEAYLSDWELVDGQCPFHPQQSIEKIKEKNYFFRWSKYENFLKQHLFNHPEFAQPKSSRKEMLAFLDRGIRDIPVSRQNIKWGIPVPNLPAQASDPSQTIYVWFDALINYLTGDPNGFWPADIHVLGKDNTRWHVLLWPAMLKSAGYELPKTIYTHGFLSLDGQKISKSLGNIIRPTELVDKFGVDAVRYFLMRFKPLDSDGDIAIQKIKEIYNADLANGLGNLTQRINKLAVILLRKDGKVEPKTLEEINDFKTYQGLFESFKLNEVLALIWSKISVLDKRISKEQPWALLNKNHKEAKILVAEYCQELCNISTLLEPFMPKTSQEIKNRLSIRTGIAGPLFPRK